MPPVLGHERVLRALADRLASGRMPHAWLFSGVAGIGKKRVALELARGYLCPHGNPSGRGTQLFDAGAAPAEAATAWPADGCACASCAAVRALRHPDLLLVHDFQSIRWQDAAHLRAIAGGDALAGVIEELRAVDLVLDPASKGHEARIGLSLDHALIFRGNTFDPTPFAERLGRMEERGTLSPAARRIAAALYFDESSRFPFRSSLGIHIIARREPHTPDRGSMREFLSRTSFHGGGKVVVIDDAHLLTPEAQNAFLKTLEEPPAGTLIILVTAEPGTLLPTIRSRTQEVRFGRLPPALMAATVREQGAGEAAGDFIAAWADGSLGRALEGHLEGLDGRRDLAVALHRALVEDDLAAAMAVGLIISGDEVKPDRLRRHRRMRRNLELLLAWYRDLAVAADGGAGPAGEGLLNRDLAAHIRREAAARSPAEWRRAFAIVAGTLADLSASSDYHLQASGLVASLALADRAARAGSAA